MDERFVVKFAWSEIRAVRLWREGVVLERLRCQEPQLALPEVVVARQIAEFLVRLHGVEPGAVIGGLPVVSPTVQADTEGLLRRAQLLLAVMAAYEQLSGRRLASSE